MVDLNVHSYDDYISVNDMGFLYGFGIFETFLVEENGKVFLLQKHIERLLNSITFFGIENKYTKEDIENNIYNHIKENNLNNKVLRITISAGNIQKGIASSITYSSRENLYTSKMINKGCSLCFTNVRKSESSILLRHKTSNYLENFYLMKSANNRGYDDLIFLNSKEVVTETTKSNIFFVKNRVIHTPNIDCGILSGVIRQWVLDVASKFDIKCVEGNFLIGDLIDAQEVFVTNSVMGAMHVREIEGGYKYKYGEITELFKSELAKNKKMGMIF